MDALAKMRDAALRARAAGRIAHVDESSLEHAYLPLALDLLCSYQRGGVSSRMVAIAGGPGSGKSTLSEYLEVMLQEACSLRCARFGLDDVYFSRKRRIELGHRVHPLFAIRGAPGTHNTGLLSSTLSALKAANSATVTALPRFDKSEDDIKPRSEWPLFVGKPDLIVFDTWLWNVVPPSDEDLTVPINQRETEDDPDGSWRLAAARALRRDYLSIFGEADEWIKFEPPNWEATIRFREEQERDRLRRLEGGKTRPEKRESIRAFLELLERWVRLPHASEPQYRIILNEQHSARLLR